MAKFVLSKEKETHTPTQAAASEASNQQRQPVAATSNGKAGEKASEVVHEQVEKVVEDVQEPMVVATEPKESQVQSTWSIPWFGNLIFTIVNWPPTTLCWRPAK